MWQNMMNVQMNQHDEQVRGVTLDPIYISAAEIATSCCSVVMTVLLSITAVCADGRLREQRQHNV